ncbi:MAG: N-acetylneuraminate synthase family protein [Treponema sp.]|nr:N-acetylneuraminate synthase family protein [Treponema sp.]
MEKKNPFIIAELGSSHGGDIIKAKELISAAAEAGADCVKCQIIFADEILHPKTGKVKLPGGDIPLYEVFKSLEKDENFYREMKNQAELCGIQFLATPFGQKSAKLLKKLNPTAVKIASPELNYTDLLKEIGSWGQLIYLSTGVSTLGDIEEAVGILNKAAFENSKTSIITLLHCVTAYPAPPENYNLRVLPNLAGIFGTEAGISDHSLNPVLVPVLGYSMGAVVIEKHFCLSRNDPGLDDPIALDPITFKQMYTALHRAVGLETDQIIKEMKGEFGSELVEKTLGNGVKTLSASEKTNYGRTNRSVHALRDIAEGETIKPEMIAVLRTEKILRPGLHPRYESAILGRKARNTIPAGEGVRFQDV